MAVCGLPERVGQGLIFFSIIDFYDDRAQNGNERLKSGNCLDVSTMAK